MDNATNCISGSMCVGDIKFIYIPKVNNGTKPSQGRVLVFLFCFVLKINTEKRKYFLQVNDQHLMEWVIMLNSAIERQYQKQMDLQFHSNNLSLHVK